MNKIFTIAKRKVSQLIGLFPSKLPVGLIEFNAWAEKFSSTYNLPTKDTNSVRFVLATSMLNFTHITSHKSMYYFYKVFMSAAVKQVAGSVFQDIKRQQQEVALAAKNDEQK